MGKFDFSSWAKAHKTRLCQPEEQPALLRALWERCADFTFRGDILKARKKINSQTLAQKNRIKPETLLEFFYTAANEQIYNQFAFSSGERQDTSRIAADMIALDFNATDPDPRRRRPVITQIIELKVNPSAGDFYHACYEVIYYYFLMLRAQTRKDPPAVRFTARYALAQPITLIVRAPADFLQKDKTRKKAFLSALNTLLTPQKAQLSFEPIPETFLPRLNEIQQIAHYYEYCKLCLLHVNKKK
jgi:hypothetical protein